MAKREAAETNEQISNNNAELAKAIVDAVRASQPIQKKNPFNRKSGNPFLPQDGTPRSKFKRKAYQHGILVDEDRATNEVIDLFNKLRPGTYCEGYVKVTRRRDKGIDITYPIRTASQRLRLVNQFGIRSISELLQYCINEAAKPKKQVEDDDN